MAIDWKILGAPGADNALLVTVDSGQSHDRLLFDCGEGCLSNLKPSEIQGIDHLFFSHFHMDHVSGFDTFFRHNYNRPDVPVQVWGPEGTLEILANRFRSFTWNLHADQPGEWIVRETKGNLIRGARFLTREAFDAAHDLPEVHVDSSAILRETEFTVESRPLPHHTMFSNAYLIRQSDSHNVSPEALASSGLKPGPWLQSLNMPSPEDTLVKVDGTEHRLGDLRDKLLLTTAGKSLAYLTDFCLEPSSQGWSDVATWLNDCDTLVCECQYAQSDSSLALRNGHMTADRVGQLANEASVKELVLLHLSRRYSEKGWAGMQNEAAAQFPGASFPPDWNIG